MDSSHRELTPAGLIRLVTSPENSVIALAAWRLRTKLLVFLVAYLVFWLLGLVLNAESAVIEWRLIGFFVPVLAALLWGGVVGLVIFLVNSVGIHELLWLREVQIVGGFSGPIMGIAMLGVIGLLRYYVLQLHYAQERIATLEGIIPICATCKKIRDETGDWHPVEAYVSRQPTAQFSHGLCPDCYQKEMEQFDAG